MSWLIIAFFVLIGVWIVRDYRRNRPASEAHVAAAVKKQMQTGHFTLAGVMKTIDEEKLRQQFPEVADIIASANGYPATKEAMTTVRLNYPAFAEAARHLQIIGESLDIIERTKNRATLESRIEVVKANQSAMYAALPFRVEAENIAAQEARNEAMFDEARQRLPGLPLLKHYQPP